MKLEIVPIYQKEANQFVKLHHRHHKPVVGSIFQIACAFDGNIVGVAIVGRPVSRRLDNKLTLEVNRLCTDGTKNVCSKLYAACWRIAKEMGYKKLITYILDSEKGTSLNAAGWVCIGQAGGKSWNVASRPRVDNAPRQLKIKYEVTL